MKIWAEDEISEWCSSVTVRLYLKSGGQGMTTSGSIFIRVLLYNLVKIRQNLGSLVIIFIFTLFPCLSCRCMGGSVFWVWVWTGVVSQPLAALSGGDLSWEGELGGGAELPELLLCVCKKAQLLFRKAHGPAIRPAERKQRPRGEKKRKKKV